MENTSITQQFEYLKMAIVEQNFQYLFSDQEDAAIQMIRIEQAVISYKKSKIRGAMHSRLTQNNDFFRDELSGQLIHLNEICDAYGMEHIFTGDANSESDLEDFVNQC